LRQDSRFPQLGSEGIILSSRKAKMVSIIIVSHNRKKDVLECLESVKQLDYSNYEVIVVDNGSTDGAFETLKEERGSFKLVETGQNLGTAAAINVGVRNSKGEFFLLLNDDVVVKKDAVTELVHVMESDSRIGVAGSLTYFYDKPDEIWFYPREFSIQKRKRCYIDFVTAVGCAFMIKKAVVGKTGLFDKDYFYCHEEADFCLRARKQGFRVVCALRSSVYHKIPIKDPAREFSLVRVYYTNRNFFLFAKKNYTRSKDRLNFLFQSFIFYPYFVRGKPILRHFPWIIPLKALMALKIDFLAEYFKGIAAGIAWFLVYG
jgi:GT2 family glycosyltransferase